MDYVQENEKKKTKNKNRTSRLDSCYQMSQLTKFEFFIRWIQPDFYVKKMHFIKSKGERNNWIFHQ